ncbi:ABC transporter permease [Desulfobotulus mexicanus]|uniref:ABC transporter permease n=1 Tax=Desulfobotulus mexicanus TaxID=2586642 RepID=A0A5S5MF95_9BACT|nr:ABC transporter permease [Desulfobotulus mexicanus]TYT74392.1 ABC transporter permease [Desulfobotulus mexicanus]
MKAATRRRWERFLANRKGLISLILFIILFFVSLFAEFIANDRPLMIRYQGETYFPVLKDYNETVFGGDFATLCDYRDPYIRENVDAHGFMIWPPIRFSYNTIRMDLPEPAPSRPDRTNLLGTDDQGRDVLARVIYGYRVSVLFGLCLAFGGAVIGTFAGALQGYYGGKVDLIGQRFMEIWSGLPVLYLIMILSSVVTPSFFWLLGLMLLFGWMSLVGVVRAEFLRGRNLGYVKAARVMGMTDRRIMFRHILPNAMVAALTFFPFILNGAITTLTALDFLGFGLPPGSPSLGELLSQGKTNLHAPWLGITAFCVLSIMLTLLIFVGEAVRDAFDPRLEGL